MPGEVLELLAHQRQLRDVVAGDDDALDDRVGHVADELEADGAGRLVVAGHPHPGLEGDAALAVVQARQRFGGSLHVGLVDEREQRLPDHHRRVVAEDPGERGVDARDDAVAVEQQRDRRRDLHEVLEPGQVAGGHLPHPTLGDVAGRSDDARRAVGELHGPSDQLQPVHRSVDVVDADLDRRADLLGLHRLHRRDDDGDVVGVDDLEDRVAAPVLVGVAELLLRGPVEEADHAVGIHHQHAVGDRVDELAHVHRAGHVVIRPPAAHLHDEW